jgi:hypothetical protein
MPRCESAFGAVHGGASFNHATSPVWDEATRRRSSPHLAPARVIVSPAGGPLNDPGVDASRAGRLPRRFVVVGVVALVHVALLYWLAFGFVVKPREIEPPAVQATIIY